MARARRSSARKGRDTGADVVSAIATVAKKYSITQILVGRTRQPWYKRWFGPSFLDRLVLTVEGADVIVVGHF